MFCGSVCFDWNIILECFLGLYGYALLKFISAVFQFIFMMKLLFTEIYTNEYLAETLLYDKLTSFTLLLEFYFFYVVSSSPFFFFGGGGEGMFWRVFPSYWVFVFLVMHLLLRLFMKHAKFKLYFLCGLCFALIQWIIYLLKKKKKVMKMGQLKFWLKIYQLDVHILHLLNCCIIPNWNLMKCYHHCVIFGGKNNSSSFNFMAQFSLIRKCEWEFYY